MYTIAKTCGRCHELVDFVFADTYQHTIRTPDELQAMRDGRIKAGRTINVQTLQSTDVITASAHTYCPRCKGPTMIVYRATRRDFDNICHLTRNHDGHLKGTSPLEIIEAYPKPAEPDADPHWPEKIVRLFKDAQNMMYEKKTPSLITGACRTVLDISTKELGATNKTLFDRINKLRTDGIITDPIRDWAHSIRLDGNSAVHEGEGEENDAKEYVEFLRMFLNMTFSLPARIEAKRQSTNPDP